MAVALLSRTQHNGRFMRSLPFLKMIGLSLFAGLATLPMGCGSTPEMAECAESNLIRGVCAGVPPNPICSEDLCTADVECTQVTNVSNDSELENALGEAASGSCIALAPGSYGVVSLPSGVSLLGKSAEVVTVQGVSVAQGAGGVIRGLKVTGDGVSVAADAEVTLEAVQIDGASAVGLTVESGANVTVAKTSVAGSGKHGVKLVDGAVLSASESIIEDNDGPGIWSVCEDGCNCVNPPSLTLTDSIVRGNHVGGVVLFGTVATVERVDIVSTLVGDDFMFGEGGGGLSVNECSDLMAKSLQVLDSQSFGVLIDDSNAQMGETADEGGVLVSGNEIGVWVQHISLSEAQTVRLEGLTAEDNYGVGIGADGDTVGLIICKTAITGTAEALLPITAGVTEQVGDGLLWLGGSELTIEGLTVGGSARASIVIDGEASGSMTNVVLEGGDESKGILQQNYAGGSQPQVGSNAPAISTSDAEEFAMPEPPATLSSGL
ncbi:MAG: right-handed parallel beta-helix repeat-containing protein [Polyangiaceae bacterium]|nr:right-handed parallel beta-helix repeat-containing protein [Polyangiaceae bacterium]